MMPKFFGALSSHEDLGQPFTSYVVLTGKDALFESKPDGKGREFKEVTDGLSNTIMIVEVEGLDIPWMKPQDIDITEFVRGEILKGKGHQNHVGGFNACMADGAVKFFRLTVSPEDRKALSTRAGGEAVQPLRLMMLRNHRGRHGARVLRLNLATFAPKHIRCLTKEIIRADSIRVSAMRQTNHGGRSICGAKWTMCGVW